MGGRCKERGENRCYFVLKKTIGKILCSLWTDLIELEVQCGQCLFKLVNKREIEMVRLLDVT